MAPTAKIAIMEAGLGAEEAFTFRLKLPDGYRIAPHIHPAYERVTVLSGIFHFAHGREFDLDKTHALKRGGFAIMEVNSLTDAGGVRKRTRHWERNSG